VTTAEILLKLVEVLAWPSVALIALIIVRPQIAKLFAGARVKLSILGQSIETTLPELQQILEEQAGERLSAEHTDYLNSLFRNGAKSYPDGVKENPERKLLRPLRNNGLILTVPRNAFLADARAIELSALGRLYLRGTTRIQK
jgi:hypothetical protein